MNREPDAASVDENGRIRDCGHVLGELSTGMFRCIEVLYPPKLVLAEHRHTFASISICFSGGLEEVIAGIRFGVEPSSVYTRPGGVLHSNAFGPEHTRALVLELEPAFRERYPDVIDLVRHPAIFQGAPILSTANALSAELRRGGSHSRVLGVDALGLTLVTQLLRKGEGVHVSATTAWVNDIAAYLKKHFREHLTVNEIAAKFDLHPSYLGRVFKRELQLSVIEYLRKLRVEYAAEMLATTATPISEIAEVCAFADQAHFTRVFKSVVGTTPRGYRRMAKQPRLDERQPDDGKPARERSA